MFIYLLHTRQLSVYFFLTDPTVKLNKHLNSSKSVRLKISSSSWPDLPVFLFLFLPGCFTKRHQTHRRSQHEYRTSALADLPANTWGFHARRGVCRLQTKRLCRRQKRRAALEGKAVSWTGGRRWRVSTEPLFVFSLACRAPPFAFSWAELLASHGQRLQRVDVAEGVRAG